MRKVIQVIDQRTEAFKQQPLFAFLKDKSIDPADRLAFAPSVAHYVVTFGDVCRNVLREDPPRDKLQEIVNAQADEESEHWKWFLSDLGKLGYDPMVRYSDALKFIWSDESARSRMLAYKLCRHALGADSLHKLVVVHCAEATANVTIKHVVMAGKDWTEKYQRKLAFFGGGHDEVEDDHTLWTEETLTMLDEMVLGSEVREELIAMVHECFDAFEEFTNEMLAVAKSGRTPPAQVA